ncbi:MAG TPA: 3-deoxy-8-phosphooctulonate synthase, partial [Syntrophales bacterium]|nr:3-deoxy-8-phosphooctulonate synthase [Syntrophales bacterium]
MKTKQVMVGSVALGGEAPLALIAGPCVLETEAKALEIARYLKTLAGALEIGLIFKASYDKANRTSLGGFRGPGLKEGLEILAAVKRECDVPVLTDVHRFEEIGPAAAVADVLQVPAFLCRQTDFVMEVARRA